MATPAPPHGEMLQTHAEGAAEPGVGLTVATLPRCDFTQIPIHAPAAKAIQTKLAISKPGDEYEQEADRIADQVMATPAHPAVSSAPLRIQRYSGQSNGQVDATTASVEHALASPGRPLEPTLRQDMEQRFGHDFSRVRVHSGASAAQSAQAVRARAYTVGRDIVFAEGQCDPSVEQSRKLLAHELTHMIQQSSFASAIVPPQDSITPEPAERALKRTGEGTAKRLETSRGAPAVNPQTVLQRAPADDPKIERRQRAKSLKAADARTLLQASLPFVLEHMSEAQIQQMQKVLDAAVVNPDVSKEVQDLERKSIVAQSGSLTIWDPKMVRRAERARESFVPVTEADKRIHLDYRALLAPDALRVTTDNPDEAAYLERVRRTLATRGVWLRFAPTFVRDPEDPSRYILDQRTFEAWLSLGPDGDTIPTDSGRLTRDALLNTTVIGAGYYERVDEGGVQSALKKEINRLLSEIEAGIEQHNMLAKIRRDAFVGVAEISEFLGGADLPDRSIWDQPHQFVLEAMKLNVGGNVKGSQAYLVTAAILTRNAAQLLADYLNDIGAGAGRALKVLKVVKTAGEIAEVGLAVTGVVGIVRGAVAIAGAGAASTSAATGASVDAAAERLVRQYVAENPEIAGDLDRVTWVKGPKRLTPTSAAPESEAAEVTRSANPSKSAVKNAAQEEATPEAAEKAGKENAGKESADKAARDAPDRAAQDAAGDATKSGGEGQLSEAGRSLTKHAKGQRPGSKGFPEIKGNPEQINKQASEILDGILHDPDRVVKVRPGKGGEEILQVNRPDGTGAIFKKKDGQWVFSNLAENLF
jgi:hypothetical protein